MPTTAATTYSNAAVDPIFQGETTMDSSVAVKLKASSTFAAGTILGEITATPGVFGAYASANVDGTQNPTGILRRAVTTDASSNITNYDEWSTLGLVGTMYIRGSFRTQDLTGLDANAISKLGGHLVQGTVTTGVVTF